LKKRKIQNHISDGWQYFQNMSPRKLWGLMKLVLSYHISKLLHINLHWGMPIGVAIEPTTSCNLRCPQCPSGLQQFSRATGKINPILFQKMIDQLGPNIHYLTFYFQGEPYLHPNFLEMVSYASQKRIYVSTSTNAHYLDDEKAKQTVLSGLDRIVISMDGVTQESYESYRMKGKLEKVIQGIENLVKWKKILKRGTPYIVLQFIVFKKNQHELDTIKSLAEKWEVDDLQIKTAQIYDYNQSEEWIPDDTTLSRYVQNQSGEWVIKNQLLNQCWRMWSSAVLTWDGQVVPCCFDKDAKYRLGTLEKETFKNIWKSKPYQNFRSQILKSRKEIDICQNCTEGTKVWA